MRQKEFESASIEAGSEGSGWLEIFVHGKLGKNNAGRLADAAPFSGCSLEQDPHRESTLTRIAIFSTGTRQKRLDVLGIEIFLVHGRRALLQSTPALFRRQVMMPS
jgi:hypothetical protein